MVTASAVRAMKAAELDDFFASVNVLAPLVGRLEAGVDGALLVGRQDALERAHQPGVLRRRASAQPEGRADVHSHQQRCVRSLRREAASSRGAMCGRACETL